MIADSHRDKELLWLACAEKSCCSYYSVAPTGADLWKISRAMELPPTAFTNYTDAPPDSPFGFALDTFGRLFQVVLSRHHLPDRPVPSCVFLYRLPDGHAQCGLGALRPAVCQSFPLVRINGIVCIGECDGCSCRTWALAHVDPAREDDRLRCLERDRAEYAEVVRRWNDQVRRAPEQASFGYPEYCGYLINAYAGLQDAPIRRDPRQTPSCP